MSWAIVYDSGSGVVVREGKSTMEYYRILNQLKFRDIQPLVEPPSN